MFFSTYRNLSRGIKIPASSSINPTLSGDYSPLYSSSASSIPGIDNSRADLESTWWGELLYGTADRDARDWARQELSSQNALFRDLYKMDLQNAFNERQNDLAFDRQKWFAENGYQLAMESMKRAGLNPILAYQQGPSTGTSVPTTSSGSGSASGGSSFSSSDTLVAVATILASIAGLVASTKTKTNYHVLVKK